MRILILSPSVYPQPGGLQRYTYNLAVALAQQKHDVFLITLLQNDFSSKFDNLVYQSIGNWGRVDDNPILQVQQKLYLVKYLHDVILQFQPDRILCTWWEPFGYLAAAANRIHNCPMYCIGHGQEILRLPDNSLKRLVKRWLRDFTFRSAHKVIAVSKFTKSAILNETQISRHKLSVIPNGLSSEYLQAAERHEKNFSRKALALNGYVVLQVGRVVPRKGHALVLEILPELIDKLQTEVTYIIVGSGPYKEYLQNKAFEVGISKQTIFTGFIPDEQLHLYYSAADVVVMPAFNSSDQGDVEGFGIVYLEAYAHGKPVIGTRAGGVADAILHNKTGLLVAPGDSSELLNGIVSLLKDRSKAEQMGQNGRSLVDIQWNWDTLSQQVVL